MNVTPLTAEISSGVWNNPACFNGFRVLASLLHRHHSMEVNQSVHGVWLSPWLLHYINIHTFLGELVPWRYSARCKIHFASKSLRFPILAALVHGTPAVGVGKTLRRGILKRQGGHPVRHLAVELSSYGRVALWNRADHFIFILWFLISFFLSSSFFLA